MRGALCHVQLAGCCLLFLDKAKCQDAVFQGDLDVVGVDVVGKAEATFVVDCVVLAGAGCLDGQDVLFHLDVQVFLLDAGEFHFQGEAVFYFVVVGLGTVGVFALDAFGGFVLFGGGIDAVQAVDEILETVESSGDDVCIDHNFTSLLSGLGFPLALCFCLRHTYRKGRANFWENAAKKCFLALILFFLRIFADSGN